MRNFALFLSAAALVAIPSILPSPAYAWGPRAHAVVDQAAIATLPADGPVFLQKFKDYIAASSSMPDTWRSPSEPFSKIEEDPDHGWFREQFAFVKPIPRSRYEFVLALYREHERIKDSDPKTALRTNVRWTGTLPFAAMESYGRMVACMRIVRMLRATGKDSSAYEQNCAYEVAVLGHYIGDGAQPLHDTVNSDGWLGDDPKGYTRNHDIHGRFESKLVDAMALEEKDVVGLIGQPGRLTGDLFDAVLAFLNTAGDKMEAVYALEKRGALENPQDKEARQLVYTQVAQGAAMLRDMVNRAWIESGTSRAVINPSPLDTANPAYNSETGSAPAG